MWEVIQRSKGKEKVVAGPLSYSAAYQEYEPLAEKINATDDEGNYLHPDVRVSIRRAQAA